MRRYMWVALCAGALVSSVLLSPTANAATTNLHFGQRLDDAFTLLADPVECAAGACTAVSVSAFSGSQGAASTKMHIDGFLMVQVYPATLVDGQLFVTGEALWRGCTMQVDVKVSQRLTDASVATNGTVAMNKFVGYDDGSFECSVPNGHMLNLKGLFTGTGVAQTSSGHGLYLTPWNVDSVSSSTAMRTADATVTGTVDSSALPGAWPGSGMLIRNAYREVVVNHRVAVGSLSRQLHFTQNASTLSDASGQAGDWSMDAMTVSDPSGNSKTFVTVSTLIGDQWCWGDSAPPAAQLSLPTDLSGASATTTVELRCGEFGDVYGTVTVAGTWTGVGTPSWFKYTEVNRDPMGSGTAVTRGQDRNATFSLVVNGGEPIEGSGYLVAQATTMSAKVR